MRCCFTGFMSGQHGMLHQSGSCTVGGCAVAVMLITLLVAWAPAIRRHPSHNVCPVQVSGVQRSPLERGRHQLAAALAQP